MIHVPIRASTVSPRCPTSGCRCAAGDLILPRQLDRLHCLQKHHDFREYVVHYTNAATKMVRERTLRNPIRQPVVGTRRNTSTSPTRGCMPAWKGSGNEVQETSSSAHGLWGKNRGGQHSRLIDAEQDETLQHPRCVYEILKRHFARLPPDLSPPMCGAPEGPDSFVWPTPPRGRRSTGPERKAGAICYAVGWTRHSTGVQIVRAVHSAAAAGNMGRPAAASWRCAAARRLQGSTDIPHALRHHARLSADAEFRVRARTPCRLHQGATGTRTRWWHNTTYTSVPAFSRRPIRRRGDRGERIRLRDRLPRNIRRPLAIQGYSARQLKRRQDVEKACWVLRAEPGRRRTEHAQARAGARWRNLDWQVPYAISWRSKPARLMVQLAGNRTR